MRRTTTHDCTRPHGFDGPVRIVARGLDARDDDSALAAMVLDIEVGSGGTIERLDTDPSIDALQALIGTSAHAGFRRAAASAIADDGPDDDLTRQLLDDLPTAFMLSGRVLRTNGIPLGRSGRGLPIDICAGWIDGGTLVRGYTELGPPLHRGPEAEPIEPDEVPLPPHATRRRRGIDVWIDDDDDGDDRLVGRVDAFFRDTHAGDDGIETVVHQYRVEATIDLATMTITTCTADPGPLPYPECPSAAASATQLTGAPLDGLRRDARRLLRGPSTCTHLTDVLGCLEGAGPLLRTIQGGSR